MTVLLRAVASLFLITLILPYAVNADVVYEITPYELSNDISIDGGSITVSDSAAVDGTLEVGEILGFSVNITTPTGPINFNRPGSEIYIGSPVRIDRQKIFLGAGDASGYLQFQYTAPGEPIPDWVLWSRTFEGPFPVVAYEEDHDTGVSHRGYVEYAVEDAIIIATVPEPTSITWMGLGMAGLLASGSRRKRKSASAAS